MLKNSKYGLGIGLLFLGIVFVVINYFTISYEQVYLPKLLLSGFIIGFLGIGLILFPGPVLDQSDVSGSWKRLWRESKVLHRIMWIVFTLAGVAAGILTFIYFDLKFD